MDADKMKRPWKMSRREYTKLRMPARAMGGGVCERILAREHAIQIQVALVAGKAVSPRRVMESHEILGAESKYPRALVEKYPCLRRKAAPWRDQEFVDSAQGVTKRSKRRLERVTHLHNLHRRNLVRLSMPNPLISPMRLSKVRNTL